MQNVKVIVCGLSGFIAACLGTCASADPVSKSAAGLMEMPESRNGDWILNSPYGAERAWGREEMIRHLRLVCKEWRRRYPDRPRVRIGDISKPDGSPFPPHNTHMLGLAVDIKTRPVNVVDIGLPNQQQPLELAELFYTFGATSVLYGQPHDFDGLPIVTHAGGHENHFHVNVNPANVPSAGDWVFMPRASVGAGGSLQLGCELLGVGTDSRGEWSIVAPSVLKEIVFQFDDMDDANGIAVTSRPIRPQSMTVRAPSESMRGPVCRWRLQIVTPTGIQRQSYWYALETPKTSCAEVKCHLLCKDSIDLPLHFTVLTKKTGAQQRATAEKLLQEVEALNKAYSTANPDSKVLFRFQSVCQADRVIQSGSPLAAQIDAELEYDRDAFRSLVNSCTIHDLVSPSAVNVFIWDAYTGQRGFSSRSSWVQRNTNKPYILLDLERPLDAGLVSSALGEPALIGQSLRSNPRLLRDANSGMKTDNQGVQATR